MVQSSNKCRDQARASSAVASGRRRKVPIVSSSASNSVSVLMRLIILTLFRCSSILAAAAEEAGGIDEHAEAEGAETRGDGSSTLRDTNVSEVEHHEEGEIHDAYAVLFPWFTEAVGVFAFLLLTRKLHALPYTAVMFLVGTFMGVGANRSGFKDELTESIYFWTWIDGEVVLLVFLPGLLFWDALDVNFHLFQVSFVQLVMLAFPMVLAGTTLTALVAYYIFPYGWSFMLSMTLGSILAATDPVAVAALLNEVGAPPRLKMHISGESLLNDGSAVVFWSIFSALFMHELGIGLGEQFSIGGGLALFFRMSLGGAAVGLGFGFGLLLLLFYLDRRLEKEENVMQVAATITVAYVAFYVSEITCCASGVIAVVACGITTRAFGKGMINDRHILESFWILVEHLLNTLLFTLGGVVWGETISQQEPRFEAQDWGYLIVLYVFVIIIRFFLLFAFYPILSKIGIKTNIRETIFMSFGGLRGAVGIALALSVDQELNKSTNNVHILEYSSKLFGMVGGISLLTLVINGTLAGPLLKTLGLANTTDSRARIVDNIRKKIRDYVLDRFIHLLADPRFGEVGFAVVRHHVPHLKSLTAEDLKKALHENKKSVSASLYQQPNLKNIMPYLKEEDFESGQSMMTVFEESDEETKEMSISDGDSSHRPKLDSLKRTEHFNFNVAKELRMTFLELVGAAYQKMVEKGELDSIETGGFVVYSLQQSLDIAADKVSRGKPLCDWKAAQTVSAGWTDTASSTIHHIYALDFFRKRKSDTRAGTHGYHRLRSEVNRALAFISAHRRAQEHFQSDFNESSEDFKSATQLVRLESEEEVEEAEKFLLSLDCMDVKIIISHLFCVILLNKTARFVSSLSNNGLLKPREAQAFIEEIEEALAGIHNCSQHKHPGEIDENDSSRYAHEKDHSALMLRRMKARSKKRIRDQMK